jgi:hypothetical protein
MLKSKPMLVVGWSIAVCGLLGACGAVSSTLAGEDDFQTRWERQGANQPMVTESAAPATEADRETLKAAGAELVGQASVSGDGTMTAMRNRAQRLAATNGATHCFLPPETLEVTSMMAECVRVPVENWEKLSGSLRPAPKAGAR